MIVATVVYGVLVASPFLAGYAVFRVLRSKRHLAALPTREGGPPLWCAGCGYTLAGLSENVECPECGCADRNWGIRLAGWKHVGIMNAVGLVLSAAAVYVSMPFAFGQLPADAYILASAFVLPALVVAALVLTFVVLDRTPYRFAIITSAAVFAGAASACIFEIVRIIGSTDGQASFIIFGFPVLQTLGGSLGFFLAYLFVFPRRQLREVKAGR